MGCRREEGGSPARLPGSPGVAHRTHLPGILHLTSPLYHLTPTLPRALPSPTSRKARKDCACLPLRFPPLMAPPPREYVGLCDFNVGRMEGWGELYPRECALDGSGRGAGDVAASVAPSDDGQEPGRLRRTYIHPVLRRHLSALHSSRPPAAHRRATHPNSAHHARKALAEDCTSVRDPHLLRRLRAGERWIAEGGYGALQGREHDFSGRTSERRNNGGLE
ncbi:hypothetical protein B0H14DRAFT_407143 [Mycena olivaceomarginata]|nr:hypothetical protein B0H14DRAFT_407143 [Mycena olivaceomarginata]